MRPSQQKKIAVYRWAAVQLEQSWQKAGVPQSHGPYVQRLSAELRRRADAMEQRNSGGSKRG